MLPQTPCSGLCWQPTQAPLASMQCQEAHLHGSIHVGIAPHCGKQALCPLQRPIDAAKLADKQARAVCSNANNGCSLHQELVFHIVSLGDTLQLCKSLHVGSCWSLSKVVRGLRPCHAAGTCGAHCWSHGAWAQGQCPPVHCRSAVLGRWGRCAMLTSGSSLASSFRARVLREAP